MAERSPTCGVLFGGIGGDLLGLEAAGFEPRWAVEIDAHARSVLAQHWPEIQLLEDVRSEQVAHLPGVDLIAGGFPCQDISNAHTNGERRALAGPKSGLWRYFLEAALVHRPRWVIVENVAAWDRWVPKVRADLAQLGFASVPLELSAGTFGAPHKRPRCFVVADAHGEGESLRALDAEVARIRPVPRGGGYWRASRPVDLRVDDGLPRGMDRLRLLGNAVVPQVVEWIGRRLLEGLADRAVGHATARSAQNVLDQDPSTKAATA